MGFFCCLCGRMKILLGTLCIWGLLVPRGLGYDRFVPQDGQEDVDKPVSSWRTLENYSYDKYHSMTEIYQWMYQIGERHTDMVTQHFLGMTYESRPMYYLKLYLQTRDDLPKKPLNVPGQLDAGLFTWYMLAMKESQLNLISQPSSNPKKSIWMDCGIHAREWIAPAFCQWFVKEILQNYQDDSRMSRLLKSLDFYVLPVLNIDGYIYSWTTDRLWRKSRSPHDNGTCFGSDLNRNFNASWCSIGASKNCQDLTFCGTGPMSEPETKAVASFVESQKENIVCFLTIHSYGQYILLPYGYTSNKPSNYEELIQVGQKAANALKAKHGTNYRVGSSADILYSSSGSSRDWARDIGIPFSYTFELRDNGTYGFVLPETQIQPTCEETMEAVLSILDDVYAKYCLSNSAEKVAFLPVLLFLLVPFPALL